MARTIPLVRGTTYERWTVEEYVGGSKYRCRCACGSARVVARHALVAGRSKQCRRCASKKNEGNLTHGQGRPGRQSPVYKAWDAIVQRCCNPKAQAYKNYGGRGITICDKWRGPGGFISFYEHVGGRPSNNHTIDRIDNAKGYEPGNVRWATWEEQQNNRRNNVLVEHNGETRTVAEWAKGVGVPPRLVYHRLYAGWSIHDALGTPVRESHRKIEWNGVTKTIPEWADVTGIPIHTIRKRLKNGWPAPAALANKPWKRP